MVMQNIASILFFLGRKLENSINKIIYASGNIVRPNKENIIHIPDLAFSYNWEKRVIIILVGVM